MSDNAGRLIARLEERAGVAKNALSERGFRSVFDIVRIPRDEFIRRHHEINTHRAVGELYDRAMGYAQQVAFAYRQQKQVRATPFSVEGPTYIAQFEPDWQAMAPVGSLGANTSPVAYLTSLYRLALQQEERAQSRTVNSIAKRRPDIPAMLIDDEAVNKVIPTLEIVNDILSSAISAIEPGRSTDTLLASTYYPNSLPYHFAHDQALRGMEAIDTTLADVKLRVDPEWPWFPELHLVAMKGHEERVSGVVADDKKPAVAALSDGGWIVAWQKNGPDGSGWGIYQQRYDRFGSRVDREVRVNSFTLSNQSEADVKGLNDGGWVVVWNSQGQASDKWDIYQQRYSRFGEPAGPENLVNSDTKGIQQNPSIGSLQDGGWIVVWEGQAETNAKWNIHQQRFDATGSAIGQESQVNEESATGDAQPLVAGLKSGGWAVAWNLRAKSSVRVQRFGADGGKIGTGTQLGYSEVSASENSLTALEGGGFVLLTRGTYNGTRIYQYRFDNQGDLIASSVLSYGDADQVSCSALRNGGWVVASRKVGSSAVLQDVFDPVGKLASERFVVTSDPTTQHDYMNVAGLKDGGWVVVWQVNGNGIFQKRFNSFLEEGQSSLQSGRMNEAVRIGSQISPALRDTIEHPPYFSTVMQFVSNGDSWPRNFPYDQSLTNIVSKYSVSELTPWYQLAFSAYITPEQDSVVSGPTSTVATKQSSGTLTTVKVKNYGNTSNVDLKLANAVYFRWSNGKWQAYSYGLNDIYLEPGERYEGEAVTMPLFRFGNEMTASVSVSFFLRMYDSHNNRYWRDISYTFAHPSYNGGNIYTKEQLQFYDDNFGTGAVVAAGDSYAQDNFSDVDELTERVGLTVPELEDLLATQVGGDRVSASPNIIIRNLAFTGYPDAGIERVTDQTTHEPYHYGAVYLHGGLKPAMTLSADDDGQLTLNNLTDDRMDRMNRFVRLQRLLDIPYDHLDYLLIAGMNAEGLATDRSDSNLGLHMNANTTRLLGVFNHYQQHYGATAEQFAAITDLITPYAIAPKVPLLDRVFNRRKLFDQPYVVDWEEVDARNRATPRDVRIMKQLASGLQISDSDMAFLAAQTGDVFSNSLETISAFYRVVTLSRWFGLDIRTFLRLAEMLDDSNDGFGFHIHLMMRPSIRPVSEPVEDRRDWLDWLMVLSATITWMTENGVDMAAVTSSWEVDDYRGTQGQLDFIHRLSEATVSVLVTQSLLLHADLPQQDEDGNRIDWFSLLAGYIGKDGIDYRLLDARGLVPDDELTMNRQRIAASVDVIVDGQKLSAESQAATRDTLSALIFGAQQSQRKMLSALLAPELAVDQEAILPFCRWAEVTPYLVLSEVLAQQSVTDAQLINGDLLRLLSRFAQYAYLSQHYELSPAFLDLFTRHRSWFESNSGPGVGLNSHFGLVSYQQWLHRTPKTEDDLLAVLIFNGADHLQAQSELPARLAETLGWDVDSTGKAIAYVNGSDAGDEVTMAQIAAVMRLQDLCVETGMSIQDVISAGTIRLESDYFQWQHVGQAAVVGTGQIETVS